MKITFLGGVGTVTGSMYLVRTNRKSILLDCGLYQGKREESFQRNQKLPFDIRRLDAVVLSHAHIDHSGNLPNLVKQGYSGPIYATQATVSLCESMLPDSGRIHEYDVEYVNRQRAKKGQPQWGRSTRRTMRSGRWDTSSVLAMDRRSDSRAAYVSLSLMRDILGSAMVLLESVENGRTVRLLFSGDLGQPGLPIVRALPYATAMSFCWRAPTATGCILLSRISSVILPRW